MKKRMTERGLKIAESKEIIKKTSEEFPIGTMVSQKYRKNSVGLVLSKPKIIRYDKYASLKLETYVQVMWLSHEDFGNGSIERIYTSTLKKVKSACKTK